MDRTIARAGSWAGLISVIGIVGYHLTLQVINGPRVSAERPMRRRSPPTICAMSPSRSWRRADIRPPCRPLFPRRPSGCSRTDRWSRFLGTIALVAGVVELGLIAVVMSAQAAIVVEVQAGHEVVGSFRFFDVLYNTGVDVFEATWIGAFGLAMRGKPGFARWMVGLSLLGSGLLYLKATAIWIGIPDPVTLPVAVLTVAWFVGASLGLRRLSAGTAGTGAILGLSPNRAIRPFARPDPPGRDRS
jgi:hypothetical protein